MMKTSVKTVALMLCVMAFTVGSYANTEWTNMVSPINHSVWPDIAITDFDTDGIPDIVAANPNEGDQFSAYSGLPVWIGKEYRPGADYYWALASFGYTDGEIASFPVPDPANEDVGILEVHNGNTCNHMCDWVAEIVREAGIAGVVNFNGEFTVDKIEGQTWPDQSFPYSPDPHYIEFTRVSSEDDTLFHATHPLWGGLETMVLEEPYTPRGGLVSVICHRVGEPSMEERFRILVEPSRYQVYGEFRDVSPDKRYLIDVNGHTEIQVGQVFQDVANLMTVTLHAPENGGSFRVGDKYYFNTPNGPPTTTRYVAVEATDVDKDGQVDIIGAGPEGIDIFLQTGPKLSAVGFYDNEFLSTGPQILPVWLGSYDPNTETSYINNSSIIDEVWTVKYNESDAYWQVESRYGSTCGDLFPTMDYYYSCCGAITLQHPYGYNYSREDTFTFSVKRVNWSERTGPTSPNSYTEIETGDIDRNGWDDILAAREDGGFDVFLYDGNEWTFSAGFAFSGIVTAMELKDVNSDGWLDVIASSDLGVHFWKGLTTGGWSVDMGPAQNRSFNGVVTADLNKDGFADIAATENLTGQTGAIQVWYLRADGTWFQNARATVPAKGANNIGDGFMGIVRVSNTQTIPEEWAVTCESEQANGGFFKVVGSRSGQQSTLAEVGKTFTSDNSEVEFTVFDGVTADYKVGDFFSFTTGLGPIELRQFGDLASGDLDNDGNLDLFAASLENFGVGIWFGNSNYGWIADTPPESSSSWQTINASHDLNFDGNPDIVLGSYADAGELGGGIKIWTGQHTNENTWTGWIYQQIENGEFNKITHGDFNTDGALDLVLTCDDSAQEGIWVLTGDNLGTFDKISESVTSKSEYFSVVAADFNNDGVDDIAAGHKTDGFDVFLTQPGMTWAPSSSSINTGEVLDLYPYDLDIDGDLDLIIAQNYQNAGRTGIVVYWNNGQGYFSDAPDSKKLLTHALYNYWSVTVADFDNNGVGDIIAGNVLANPGLQVYYGDFVNSEWDYFAVYSPSGGSGLDHVYGVSALDYNLDNKADIVYSTDGQGGTYMLGLSGLNFNCCGFGFGGVGYGKLRDIASDDLDNDGYPDLVMVSEQSGVHTYLTAPGFPGIPEFGFNAIGFPASDQDYVGVTVADFTSDGLPDIIASRNQDSGVSGLDFWISYRDFTMARVNDTYPENGGTYQVQADSSVYVNFSEPMDPATMTYENVQMTLEGSPVAYSFITENNNATLRITPNLSLRDKTYTVTIIGGPNGVRDNNGNMFDGNYDNVAQASPIDDFSFSYSTIDTISPSIPVGLEVTPGDAQLTLQWQHNNNPIFDQDLEGYYVIWQFAEVENPQMFYKYYTKEEVGTPPAITLRGLTNGVKIDCSLTAVDESGNESPVSGIIMSEPVATSPQIWWAGMYDTLITSAEGGDMTILAYVFDHQADVQSVEIYYDDLPTGADLIDGGHPDFPAGLGLYALNAPVGPLHTGFVELPFQLVAHDAAGNDSLMWPYYHILSDVPGIGKSSRNVPRPGTWESYFKNREMAFLRQTQLPYEKETQQPSISPDRPQILCAGYTAHPYGDFEFGASHWMTAIILDPDNSGGGHDLIDVKLYYNGEEFGDFTQSGIANEGYIDQLELSPVLWGLSMEWYGQENDPDGPDGLNHWDEGALFLEVQAFDRQGNASDVWPNFTIN